MISETVVTQALIDAEEMRDNVTRVARERDRLSRGLAEVGWMPYPSVTNFVLVDMDTPVRAAAAAGALTRRGLVPRTFGADHPLARCIRVTVRADHENDTPARCRARDRPGGTAMTTPLGQLDVADGDPRTARVSRRTRETEVSISLVLDGQGRADIATGVGFYDHH